MTNDSEQSATPSSMPAVAAVNETRTSARILLVEDDPGVSLMAMRTLSRVGYDVYHAAEGRAAVELMAREHFDLVITDILMPKMDGIELIMHLRREHPYTRVLAISGGGEWCTSDLVLAHARMLTDGNVLMKPFKPSDLLAVVQGLLG